MVRTAHPTVDLVYFATELRKTCSNDEFTVEKCFFSLSKCHSGLTPLIFVAEQSLLDPVKGSDTFNTSQRYCKSIGSDSVLYAKIIASVPMIKRGICDDNVDIGFIDLDCEIMGTDSLIRLISRSLSPLILFSFWSKLNHSDPFNPTPLILFILVKIKSLRPL